MDGAKSKYIAASEVYAAIDSGNTPLCVDARRAGFRCRCPAHHLTAWHPASRVAQRSGIAVSHQYFGRCEIAHLRACSMGARGGWAARERWTVGSTSIPSRHSRMAGKSAYIDFASGAKPKA
jgi:hypothetical protein